MSGAQVAPVSSNQVEQVRIATGAQLSGIGDLGERRLQAVEIPANTEGSAITFQGSVDGTTFYVIYGQTGAAISYNFTDPCVVSVNPIDFLPYRYIKVDTGTNQTGADALITLIAG